MSTASPLPEKNSFIAPSESNSLRVEGNFDRARSFTQLQMADGQVFCLPTELLLSGQTIGTISREQTPLVSRSDVSGAEIIPIVEEQLIIGKRTVTTGTVRLQKSVQEYQEALDEALAVRTFDVERIVLNRVIKSIPETRQEGDTTIYPLVEERLVLTKELLLKEEIHVTRRDAEKRDTQVVTLRREHMAIERIPGEGQ